MAYNLLQRAGADDGNIAFESPSLATDARFRNVSADWFDKTRAVQPEIDRLYGTRARREEIAVAWQHLAPVVREGHFGLAYRGRVLFPDAYAAAQIGSLLNIGATYPQRMVSLKTPEAAEALLVAYQHAAAAVDVTKGVTLRIESARILRAVLPEDSAYVSNEWYLSIINSAIPGARLSHWRGDDWTIYGNVLIPDTIREEVDSDYGAMLSLSNCEIGKRPLRQQPSLFRSICLNGCIWGQVPCEAFRFNRRARTTQGELEHEIRSNIQAQIPLAVSAIDKFLATRALTTIVSMKPVIAEVAREMNFSRKLASAVLAGWWLEKRETPDLANTLFSLVNGVTRAGQRQANDLWVRCDEVGGQLAQLDRSEWSTLVTRAAALRTREVDAAFADWCLGV